VLDELQSLGIGYAQGHYVGHPRPYITFEGEAARVDAS